MIYQNDKNSRDLKEGIAMLVMSRSTWNGKDHVNVYNSGTYDVFFVFFLNHQ